MVISWDQDVNQLDPAITIGDKLAPLLQDPGLSKYADEPREQESAFPDANIQALGQAGFLGMRAPERFGGHWLDPLNVTYVIEQIARVAPATAFVLLLHTLTVNRIALAGTEAQQELYLPMMAAGSLAASAWSESGVGSDKADLKTKGYRDGDVWRLTGQKAFCTGAGHAGIYMVMTDTVEGKGFFLVGRSNPGLRIGAPMDSMGLQGTHSGVLTLEGAVVPDADRIGEPGRIGPIVSLDMKCGLHSGIVAVGIAMGAFDRVLGIAKQNGSFEKFESVRVRISELAALLVVMRTHAYALARMAARYEEEIRGGGNPASIESATVTAKLFLSESALKMTTEAIAIAGKAGYLRENGLERLHRDALGIVVAAPINGQVLGSISESLRRSDLTSHLYVL